MRPRCVFCGNEVSAFRAYHRVQGWEQPRTAGGANQITLRETLEEYACEGCIRLRKLGYDENQSTLGV